MRQWKQPSKNSLDELYGIKLKDNIMTISPEEDGLKWIYEVISICPETKYYLCKREGKIRLLNISQFKFFKHG